MEVSHQQQRGDSLIEFVLDLLVRSIFVMNRTAKTAPDPRYPYALKQTALEKLLADGWAQKVGLHYSPNPRNCRQQVDVLVQILDYGFHLPPTKEDIRTLPHLGLRGEGVRNPHVPIPFNVALFLLVTYTGLTQDKFQQEITRQARQSSSLQHIFKMQ